MNAHRPPSETEPSFSDHGSPVKPVGDHATIRTRIFQQLFHIGDRPPCYAPERLYHDSRFSLPGFAGPGSADQLADLARQPLGKCHGMAVLRAGAGVRAPSLGGEIVTA